MMRRRSAPFFQEVLAICGYQILLAKNGVDAIDVLRGHRIHVDLILLDGSLCERRRGTLLEIQALRPGIPVAVMSGMSWEDLKPQLEGLPIAGYLPKPSSLREILDLIEALLHRSPGPTPLGESSLALL
jgi:two-component system, cell cycle sensor histidine kinase and response regulator CckA